MYVQLLPYFEQGEVALATSAAPTYFPPCRDVDSIRLVDGGVWANNPTMIGVVEAVSMLGAPLDAISVLRLGTSDAVVRRPKHLDRGGRLLWATAAVNVIMRGQSLGITKQAVHLLGEGKVERLAPEVSEGLFALDRISTEELFGKAAHESRIWSLKFERKFAPHAAPEFCPEVPAIH